MKMTTTWWIVAGIGTAGLAVGGYLIWKHTRSNPYGNLKPKSKAGILGVQIQKEVQGQTLTEPDWNNPYDMNYEQDVKAWISPATIQVLAPLYAEGYAKELKEAKGASWYSDDDEQAVEAVFSKKLKDKVQVANLSRAFWNRYKKDMWEYLNSFLSKGEMKKYVHDPVRKLPDYRIIN